MLIQCSAPKDAKAEQRPNCNTDTACSKEKQDWTDPFDPYEEELWVDHLSASHMLLLNKFNVVAYHVLVVTRKFEQQTASLNLQDLEATWQVVQVTDLGLTSCKHRTLCLQIAITSCRPFRKVALHTLTADQNLVQVSHTSMFR